MESLPVLPGGTRAAPHHRTNFVFRETHDKISYELKTKRGENMKIPDSLNIQMENSGASTGTAWLTNSKHPYLPIISPVDGSQLASVRPASDEDYDDILATASEGLSVLEIGTGPAKEGKLSARSATPSANKRNR